jgi:hypothetical protein
MARRHRRSPADILFRPFAGAGPYRTVSVISNRDRFRTPAVAEFLNTLRAVIGTLH